MLLYTVTLLVLHLAYAVENMSIKIPWPAFGCLGLLNHQAIKRYYTDYIVSAGDVSFWGFDTSVMNQYAVSQI